VRYPPPTHTLIAVAQSAQRRDESSCVGADGVLVLELRVERLDASNAQALLQFMKSHLQHGCKAVLSLAGVQFIDSAGLAALLSCLQHLKNIQGQLHLCDLSHTVSALFKLMRLHCHVHIYPDLSQAVQGFEGSQS